MPVPYAAVGVEDALGEFLLEGVLLHFQALGNYVLDQARRRMIARERVPNEEKILSIFRPHTGLLIRGKAGGPVEFGHMIQIQQVEAKFITGVDVLVRSR